MYVCEVRVGVSSRGVREGGSSTKLMTLARKGQADGAGDHHLLRHPTRPQTAILHSSRWPLQYVCIFGPQAAFRRSIVGAWLMRSPALVPARRAFLRAQHPPSSQTPFLRLPSLSLTTPDRQSDELTFFAPLRCCMNCLVKEQGQGSQSNCSFAPFPPSSPYVFALAPLASF